MASGEVKENFNVKLKETKTHEGESEVNATPVATPDFGSKIRDTSERNTNL